MKFFFQNIQMRNIKFFLTLILFLVFELTSVFSIAQQNRKLTLWYEKPATQWVEALPVGNGRLGAMIYGIPASEKIQLNEISFWSGGPSRNDNRDALNALSNVRQLIFAGNYSNVENLVNSNMVAKQLHGSKYQVVGNLNLTFTGHSNYSKYYRDLNLEEAKTTTTYEFEGVTYKREVFASKPDQVIVVRLTASEPGKLTFLAGFDGALSKTVRAINANTLEMTGLSSTHEGVTGQVKFDARAKIINSGGTTAISSNTIKVTGADEVIILISIATNFVDYKTITADEVERCINYLSLAESKSYNDLLSEHITAFQYYFNRINFDLGTSPAAKSPTDVRIKNFSKTYDPELVSMYYQFGRYLLISSSQPGGQPASLQGLWNESTSPAWDSKYTININTEMNYWPAEKCNLPEMHQPLIQMVKELSESGIQTARTMYGCDGWVVHHNTDIWRISGVVDGAYYGMWPMGGAWLSQHLWEKYLYNGNNEYLDSVYPILKSACEFYQDFLIPEPKHKWLVVSPSISPENNPSVHSTSICAGATMDNQILFDLFSKTIKAANILGKDSILMADFKVILDSLPPMQIGRLGQLQEWMDDWDSPSDQNRHVSHLYGLYPSNQISPYANPKLFDAAKNSLVFRGDVSTGWSMGWKVNFWARLLDGNHALKLITDQLTYVDPVSGTNGGTYPNFFDAHPPFQIDGNFGCTSGITEMLMQSHDGDIHFLPALPDDWKNNGEIDGLRAYGGFDVGFNWENGIVQKITVKSNLGGNCRIRVPNEMANADGTFLSSANGVNPNSFFETAKIKSPLISGSASLDSVSLPLTYLYDLPTVAGETYTLIYTQSPEFEYAYVEQQNPNQIKVNVNDQIKTQDRFDGFLVKIDDKVADIDSVVLGENNKQLLINLKDAVLNNNAIFLTYNSGNVVSVYEKSLRSFSDTLVDNLLTGAPPRITDIRTSEDGNSVIATFNKKMAIPDSLSTMSLSAEYNGTKDIAILQSAFLENDSTKISFTLGEQVFADYTLTLNYSGNNLVSADSGLLKPFSEMKVTNYSVGLPLKVVSGVIPKDGSSVILEFSKPLEVTLNQEIYFTLTVNGKAIQIDNASVAGSGITLSMSQKIRYGDKVTLNYTPGHVIALDKGNLESFSDYRLRNTITEPTWGNIPGKIEAEKFLSQSGIQTESTGDTGGGLNVGWIDKGDWLEYAINNTSYSDSIFITGFRLASPYGGGILVVYLDEVKIGQISCPNTGGWQTYNTFYVDLKITPGKHYLRYYISSGGFNINYAEFNKKATTGLSRINEGEFKVYPNPASKLLVIESENFKYNKLEINDLTGKTVLSHELNYSSKTAFPVNLPDGIYIVKISNDKQFQLRKIVIKN